MSVMSPIEESEVNALHKRPPDTSRILITPGNLAFSKPDVDRSGSTLSLD